MLKVNDYKIWFDHKLARTDSIMKDFNISLPKSRMRRCSVVEILDENNNIICTGISVCHDKDNFNKSYGRKKALADALKRGCFSKEFRHKVWKEYGLSVGFK